PENKQFTDIMDFRLTTQGSQFFDRAPNRESAENVPLSMPSPIAHGIAGVLTGWIVDPPPGHKTKRIVVYAAAGMAADLDLLVGAHSGPSHGIGAALIVWVIGWAILR